MKYASITGLVFFLIFGVTFEGYSQATYTINQQASEMHMYGTSNVRDWDAAVVVSDGKISVSETIGNGQWISSLELVMPVSSIDSGNSGLTDNIHKYLNQRRHPEIRFSFNEIESNSNTDSGYDVIAKGSLTVAGKTQPVRVRGTLQEKDGKITITGEHELKMTDFGIDPPRAVMGTVRARDEVKITFSVRFDS